MKKHLGLLGASCLFATLLFGASPAHAIGGRDWFEPEEQIRQKSNIVITVSGLVKDTNEEFHIKYVDLDLNSSILRKEQLLQAINYRIKQTFENKKLKAVDFANDARLTDREENLYIANPSDGSVNLGKQGIKEYRLTGHVILEEVEEAPEPPITNPAESVFVDYDIKFMSLSNDAPKPQTLSLGRKRVGEVISAQELKEKAQELLQKTHPDYTIIDQLETRITHDFAKSTYFENDNDFNYTIQNRQKIDSNPTKDSYNELKDVNGNRDSISTTYVIVKKDRLDNSGNLKKEKVQVKYVDMDTNEVLYQQTYHVDGKPSIAFHDGYNRDTRHNLLSTTLDPYNIYGYSTTGDITQSRVDDTLVVTVTMFKNPLFQTPYDHYDYVYHDGEYYTYEELRRMIK
ncbi:staphylokinase domain-containing protein [Streptococcus dysgalactiae]|uniref:staphylokinase domain-containing protein n=1 Tax=Streptococcus dysgalactiae TaxID=1334 RepID=UPI0018666C32|nr:staphylokinase domain-containing protein [Streptococcus dysgalactiae]MEC4577952.1 staphylokinase domain-containing protein [Streptococcus dysgalactiae]